jgi:hypothetical protein
MAPNPICNNIKNIDFNKEEDLYHILYQDKHTRIEGLCSEIAFMEDIVHGNLDPVTSDFWFSREDKGEDKRYHVRRIMTDPKVPLNSLDYRILDGFARVKSVVSVSIVYFNEQSKAFREVRHLENTRYDHKLVDIGIDMKSRPDVEIADVTWRNRERINKACAYLKKRGLLKEMAIKRLFANCWLGEAVWDIDAFTMTSKGKVVALEVKQKFPTPKRTFGMNKGQEFFFHFLTTAGIPVIHVVLQKPENNTSLSAIDLISLPQYTSKTKWLFTRFFPGSLVAAGSKAPAFTSIHGAKPVSYGHIPLDRFGLLKNFGISDDNISNKLFEGID